MSFFGRRKKPEDEPPKEPSKEPPNRSAGIPIPEEIRKEWDALDGDPNVLAILAGPGGVEIKGEIPNAEVAKAILLKVLDEHVKLVSGALVLAHDYLMLLVGAIFSTEQEGGDATTFRQDLEKLTKFVVDTHACPPSLWQAEVDTAFAILRGELTSEQASQHMHDLLDRMPREIVQRSDFAVDVDTGQVEDMKPGEVIENLKRRKKPGKYEPPKIQGSTKQTGFPDLDNFGGMFGTKPPTDPNPN